MNAPLIHGRYRSVSASQLRKALGDSVGRIKDRDGLTYEDVGRVFGKSEDQAAKYKDGTAEMGVVSFFLGAREWDGAFANDALALVGMRLVPIESSAASDRDALPSLTGLLHQVAVALADDGKIDDRELRMMRDEIEAAGRSIDMLRDRLNRMVGA